MRSNKFASTNTNPLTSSKHNNFTSLRLIKPTRTLQVHPSHIYFPLFTRHTIFGAKKHVTLLAPSRNLINFAPPPSATISYESIITLFGGWTGHGKRNKYGNNGDKYVGMSPGFRGARETM